MSSLLKPENIPSFCTRKVRVDVQRKHSHTQGATGGLRVLLKEANGPGWP